MNTTTLKALKSSIKHWERMRKNPPRREPKSESCALCKLFNHGKLSFSFRCVGCPVSALTRLGHCLGSPYYAAWKAFVAIKEPAGMANWRKAATAEINFLKSLLPK